MSKTAQDNQIEPESFDGSYADSETSSTDTEVEPILKYSRIESDVSKVISKSKVTAVALDERFFLLGTQNGHVHQFDHGGNEIHPARQFPVHPVAITSLSIDKTGEYYASCSNDGRIHIFGLFSSDLDFQDCLSFRLEIVCLDPLFAQTKAFVTGGDRPLFWEKGLFGKYKRSELTRLQGLVTALAWHKQYVAYSLSTRVQIYDTQLRRSIAVIEKEDTYLRNDLYPCQLAWQPPECILIVGWGKTLQVYRIFESASHDSRSVIDKKLELHHSLKLDDFICGISPFYDKVHKYIAVVCYPDISGFDTSKSTASDDGADLLSEDEESKIPIFFIIEPTHPNDYEIVNDELMKLTNFQNCLAADYKLTSVYTENIYIVFNGNDLILGVPTNLVDHLNWLFENQYLDMVLKTIQTRKNELKEDVFRAFGFKYLNRLFEMEEFEKAACNCRDILGRNPNDWEEFIYQFMQKNQLKVLCDYIPTSEPQLRKEFYELILLCFLTKDADQFLHLVNKWPGHIYNPQIIIREVSDHMETLKKTDDDYFKVSEQQQNRRSTVTAIGQIYRTLLQALAVLYQRTGQYPEALRILLKGGSIIGSSLTGPAASNIGATNYVFDIIQKRNLYASMVNEVEYLLEFDKERALEMLAEHTNEMPVKNCVEILQNSDNSQSRQLLFEYMDRLYTKDPSLCFGYGDLQVDLYADYAPHKLLAFLKEEEYTGLSWPRAEAVCANRNLTAARIYVLKKMGNHKTSLELINQNSTVEEAIKYCKDVGEQYLWDQLIESSKNDPKCISGLLNNIGTHVDPIRIIEKIRKDLRITGLRESLVKVLQDYNLQRNLSEVCNTILVKDCFELMNRMVVTQKRGQRISFSSMCLICHTPLLQQMNDHQSGALTSSLNNQSECGSQGSITAFNCSHSFHSECLALQQLDSPKAQGRSLDSRATALPPSSVAFPSSNPGPLLTRETPTYVCPQCDISR